MAQTATATHFVFDAALRMDQYSQYTVAVLKAGVSFWFFASAVSKVAANIQRNHQLNWRSFSIADNHPSISELRRLSIWRSEVFRGADGVSVTDPMQNGVHFFLCPWYISRAGEQLLIRRADRTWSLRFRALTPRIPDICDRSYGSGQLTIGFHSQ